MPKVLRYFLPVIAVAVVSSAVITPAGGEGTAGSRALAVHTARAFEEPSADPPTDSPVAEPTTPTTAPADPPVAEPAHEVAPEEPPTTVVTAPIPVPIGEGTNAPLFEGHWWCATNGACYRDPDPNIVTSVGSTDPAYEVRLNAEFCEVKPYLCPAEK